MFPIIPVYATSHLSPQISWCFLYPDTEWMSMVNLGEKQGALCEAWEWVSTHFNLKHFKWSKTK